MKATVLLEKQHRKVELILRKLEAGKSDPKPLMKELADDLSAHMAIEQDVFYPAVRSVDDELIDESFEEHAVIEIEMKRLLASTPSDSSFKAKVTTLKELIAHHVDEEEHELFPEVEKAMDGNRLESLGVTMKAKFDELSAAGSAVLLSKVPSETTSDKARKARPKDGRPSATAQHVRG